MGVLIASIDLYLRNSASKGVLFDILREISDIIVLGIVCVLLINLNLQVFTFHAAEATLD